jgi:predicted metal-dependent phosphoesterase TrpH
VQEAFNRYLGWHGQAYVTRYRPEGRQAVAVLRDAGAVPVLAHPGASGMPTADEVAAVVAQLTPHGLRGIEVYYPSHSPGQTAAYRRIAREQGLAETGGTDFHGESKPDIQMGSGFGNLHVPRELLARLIEERDRIRSEEQPLGH